MSISGSISITGNLPGMNASTAVHTRTAAGGIGPQSKSLAAAKTGALTTRTSDTAGTLTMTTGHGITDGARIAIFAPSTGCSYLATVGTVSSNSVPFTGAAGDVLPADETAVTVQVLTPLDVAFDGDKLELLMAKFSGRGVIVFEDSGDAVLDGEEIQAGEAYCYIDGGIYANPLTGNPVAQVWIANGDSSAANLFSMSGLYNSDT